MAAGKRDAEATRRRILNAGEKAFVDKGFDAARVDAIADSARVNKRMIYAYFDSKEGLYYAVLRRAFASAIESTRPEDHATQPPRARITAAIERYFAFLEQNPALVRLLSWEALGGGRRAGAVLSEFAHTGLAALRDELRAGVAAGEFRADLDERRVITSITDLAFGFFAHVSLREALANEGEDVRSPAAAAAYRDHIVRMVLDGIGAEVGAEVGHAGPSDTKE